MVVLVPGTRRSPGREISPTGIFRVWRGLVVMGSYQGCWVAARAVGWTGAQPGRDRGGNRPGNRGKNRPRVGDGAAHGGTHTGGRVSRGRCRVGAGGPARRGRSGRRRRYGPPPGAAPWFPRPARGAAWCAA